MRHRAGLLLVGLLVACSADTTVPVTDAGAASSRTMRGLYSYMADAGMFVECSSDQRLPVAMEADNLALERAYLNSRTTPGAPLLVSVEGRIEMRPKMEGDGLERTLVPLKFNSAWPGQDCTWSPGATEPPMMSLTSTRWLLADSRLAAPPPDDRSRVHLEFTADRASERTPCTGVATMQCLQIREQESDPWQLHYGEIIGFTHEPGIEYRLRILEDEVPDPPADASSKRWFLDMVAEQRVVTR